MHKDIKPGVVVSLQHYSVITNFKAHVLDAKEDYFTVRVPKDFSTKTFQTGDPVVFGFESGDEVFIRGGIIFEMNTYEKTISVKPDREPTDSESQNRLYERHPVSLYADVRTPSIRKKFLAIISDMSYYGMLFHVKEDLTVGEEVDIDIFLDRTIMSQRGTLVRKTSELNYFKYGVKIIHNDPVSYNHIKQYIKSSQQEHVFMFRRD